MAEGGDSPTRDAGATESSVQPQDQVGGQGVGAAVQWSRFECHKMAWKRALALFFKNEGFAAAGNMAFLAMLSLFPFVIFLVSVSGFLGQSTRGEEAIAFALAELPVEGSATLRGPIEGIVRNADQELLTGSILVTLWTASAGVEAARGILLKAFGWEHARVLWIRRLESLAVVIGGALLVLVSMSILVAGPAVLSAAESFLPADLLPSIDRVWDRLRLLVSPVFLFLGILGVYFALTPRRVKTARRFPGALVALAVFMVSAKGMSLYLAYAGTYDVTYGSLAGVVVTQLFCFLIALGFTLGAEVNAAYTGVFKERVTIECSNDE